ncbi:carbohydrate ABC transporter permease [Fundicoccus culcitae]|uniref:Sugar ABC transporter permease n=1 Tax=Fundicoccus culcitae TaxID=2969821 RepID=A0ABY5P9Q8_9LACT|nr:sugar ABC transporter permease [Fundicoccus culcitae]UUX35483.1 sugar ABC transporter permease [Fundicoccus culcitae]
MQKKEKQKKSYSHLAFIGPHLIIFIIFSLIPIIYGIYSSFTRWNLVTDQTFVGLDNYKTILFNKDSTFYFQFRNGLKNTLIFVVMTVPFQILFPLIVATVMQHKGIKFKGLFQAIFYVPGLVSASAGAIIWLLIFNPRLGPINNLFNSDVVWTANQPYAWIVIFVMSMWGAIGGHLVIYRSAMAGVSEDLYEAADIDGAGSIRKFFSITLPSIRFPLFYTFIMSTAGAFNVYVQPLMATNGGPEQSTTVLMMYIRNLAFGSGESIAGIASAMAVLLGLVILIFSFFQFIVMTRRGER